MIFEADKGTQFYTAVSQCQAKIKSTGRKYMMMKFNDIEITVSDDSNHDDIATIYDLKYKLRQNSGNVK